MKIAFIGIGKVGFAIANNIENKGFQVVVAHNNIESESVKRALSRNPNFQWMKLQEAIDYSDIIISSIPFSANESVLSGLKFNDKTLIDCTNPIGPGLTHGLNSKQSGSEFVQKIAADANVVKAFSIYGYENFSDSDFSHYNVKPAMLIAGDDENAKIQATNIIESMGFETIDTGSLSQALHLEHMTLLWVKMVRFGGKSPNNVWASLRK